MSTHAHSDVFLDIDCTAVEEEDFIGVSKEIILNADVSYKNVYIPIINDECLEYDEYFFVELSTSLPCVNLVNDTVTIAIENDDCELSEALSTSICSIIPVYFSILLRVQVLLLD